MHILVLNAGSSSLKWKLFRLPGGELIDGGLAERIGEGDKGRMKFGSTEITGAIRDHQAALEQLKKYLDGLEGISIDAVGHRVVHGGSLFVRPVVIDDKVKRQIRELFVLAPLHNPANLAGIEAAERYFPGIPQVAVFDTAFHQSIPREEHQYAIPLRFYEQGIRQYGFHGISHAYVSKTARKKYPQLQKIITLHLGNGASAAAVLDGSSIATSMGFGPLCGLVMGTRSGDIDPSVLLFWAQHEGMPPEEIARILNKESGLKGLTGHNDMREVEKAYAENDPQAVLALGIYSRRIKKYIGAYTALMNGLDALVFTAGIGEHSPLVRRLSCADMDFAGIILDEEKNKNPQLYAGEIQRDEAKVKILVIPTDEEKEIALQAYELLS